MATELIHIGFGNYVSAGHMIGVAAPGSAPIKRLIHEGRTKAVLFMENGAVVLAAITPETIEGRVRNRARGVEGEGE